MITDRDREVINFIEQIGYASITHIHKMFFAEAVYGYDIARKRLNKIVGEGYIRKIRNTETNENIYIPQESKLKKVSIHNMKVIDYLCELSCLGCNIEQIEIEPIFGTVKPDALISFNFNGYRYWQLLEIQIRHDMVDTKRFNNVLDLILPRTNHTVPKLIIVQNTNKDYVDAECELDIVQLKLDMREIAKVLI